MIEPKNYNQASTEEGWVKAMTKQLNQIEKSGTWEVFLRPYDKNVTSTECLKQTE